MVKKEKTVKKETVEETADMCGCGACGMDGYCGPCNCVHHYIRPGLIALFGLAFLLYYTGVIGAMLLNYTWPSLVLLYGLMKMFENRCNCCGGCC